MARALAVIGALLIVVGGFALLVTTGGIALCLKLRALVRRGVEGDAVSYHHDWMNKKYRVHYRIDLDGGRSGDFYELQVTQPEPVGSVARVVYDPRRPNRAMVGTEKTVLAKYRSETGVLKYLTGFGVPVVALGSLLVALFDGSGGGS
ncbi:DUF3592 domain-containing protein [Streptomyces sp. NPDC004267]|uniref:DUF3592 domain-containing protein n=1 Tax=Streptomyces sp. NPDC004267 TaxID=3364694 RepID=UPI0036B5A4F9